MVVIEEGTTQADYYNSISDALDAVDVICSPEYQCLVGRNIHGEYYSRLSVKNKDLRYQHYTAEAETRPAAVSLTLYEYIKEGK